MIVEKFSELCLYMTKIKKIINFPVISNGLLM